MCGVDVESAPTIAHHNIVFIRAVCCKNSVTYYVSLCAEQNVFARLQYADQNICCCPFSCVCYLFAHGREPIGLCVGESSCYGFFRLAGLSVTVTYDVD